MKNKAIMLAVRELQSDDIEALVQYWLTANPEFLRGMGVDTLKMPNKEGWIKMLSEQLSQPIEKKNSCCLIWLADNKPVGHSNVNKIIFGQEAYMHLHIWNTGIRKKGYGIKLIRLSLPWFFEKLQLKKIYCEPYALNPAPNKTLEKAGFKLVKEYITTPGWLNFEQTVKRWEMSYRRFSKMGPVN